MTNNKKLSVILFAAIMSAWLGCETGGGGWNPPPAPPANNVPPSIERIVRNLSANLEASGFEVMRGYFYLFRVEDCQYPISLMGNCFGNNPVAPYIAYAVPHWPGEYVDATLTNLWGPTTPGYDGVFRFDPKEAVIVLAHLPPPSAYFGLQHFEFTREGVINTEDPIYQWLGEFGPMMQKLFFDYAPDPTRIRIFASIGNNNNNVVVERQSGASFNQERFFITTPDQFMARTMTQYLKNAGVPDTRNIFIEPLSSALRVGVDRSAYDFSFLMRYAMPQVKADADQWRTDLPMVVLRVRDRNPFRPAEPFPGPALDPRLAEDERYLQPDLDRLTLALKNHWAQPTAVQAQTFDGQTKVDMVGPDCDVRGMNCQGDCQDTSYMSSVNSSLDNQEVYAVMGTLGTVTGNATYVNISVYEATTFMGVVSIDNTRIQGTAEQFCASADCAGVNNRDKFYLFYITRDCGSLGLDNCFSIGTDLVPTGHFFKVIQRTYIKPGTARGPDSTKLLLPVVIKLDGSRM
jgi:hypothetical protein